MKFLLYIVGAVVAGTILTLILLNLGGDPAESIFSGGRKLGPEAKKAAEISASTNDHHEADNLLDSVVAKPVACGTAARNAFDPFSGKNRYWFYRWPEGTLECFDTGGFHRITGAKLEPLGVNQIKVILADQDKYAADADLWGPPVRRNRPATPAPPVQAPVVVAPTAQPTPQAPTVVPATPQQPCCGNDTPEWTTPTKPVRLPQ